MNVCCCVISQFDKYLPGDLCMYVMITLSNIAFSKLHLGLTFHLLFPKLSTFLHCKWLDAAKRI